MADTTTANYGFIKVEISGSPSTWGNKLNNNFDGIDAQIKARADAIASLDSLKAPKSDPVFTGVPAAPTPAAKDNSTKLATTAYADRAAKSYRIVGEIVDLAHTSIPTGWLECNGQAVSRTTYAELFALIGTSYGAGNGTTTFNVPDYQELVLVARRTTGVQTVNPSYGINTTIMNSRSALTGIATLLKANLPAVTLNVVVVAAGEHSHDVNIGITGGADAGSSALRPSGGPTTSSVAGSHTHSAATEAMGSGTPFSVFQPSVVVTRVIYTGVI